MIHIAQQYRAQDNWINGLQNAREMDETDVALKLFRSGMEQADRLRSEDADTNDPNIALKAWWPSVSAYWRLVLAASHLYAQTALEPVREIKDPEMLLLIEVRLASKRFGAHDFESRTMVQKKIANSSW